MNTHSQTFHNKIHSIKQNIPVYRGDNWLKIHTKSKYVNTRCRQKVTKQDKLCGFSTTITENSASAIFTRYERMFSLSCCLTDFSQREVTYNTFEWAFILSKVVIILMVSDYKSQRLKQVVISLSSISLTYLKKYIWKKTNKHSPQKQQCVSWRASD